LWSTNLKWRPKGSRQPYPITIISNSTIQNPPINIYEGIGLMSGTSMDGVDLAFCRFTECPTTEDAEKSHPNNWSYEILKATTLPFTKDWTGKLKFLDTQSAVLFARTDVEFGHFLGSSVRAFIQDAGMNPQFVASHGQTIFHQPENTFTTQIGDGETMASYLQVPLVTQFRNKDIALGGQGAPLVPFGERLLFPSGQLFLNLGGIANLTCGDRAFDVCVCNMALNWMAEKLSPELGYDPDGRHAASGHIIPTLLSSLEGIDWYQSPPPKSLGKEWFESIILPLLENEGGSWEDKLATYSEHIANRLVHALSIHASRSDQDSLLVSGGGVHNSHLVQLIQKKLKEAGNHLQVSTDPMLTDYKEAMIFAFLGLQTLLGRPNTLISVTGAKQPCIGGSIHLPPSIQSFQLPLTPCHSRS
jgi:anhydro-N-acetylmuramic acid kinase